MVSGIALGLTGPLVVGEAFGKASKVVSVDFVGDCEPVERFVGLITEKDVTAVSDGEKAFSPSFSSCGFRVGVPCDFANASGSVSVGDGVDSMSEVPCPSGSSSNMSSSSYSSLRTSTLGILAVPFPLASLAPLFLEAMSSAGNHSVSDVGEEGTESLSSILYETWLDILAFPSLLTPEIT